MNTIEIMNTHTNRGRFTRMRSVVACASKDSTRPAINLVLVEAVKGGIVVTATDGKRLRSDKFKIKAEPGLYEIKTSNAKSVFLAESTGKLVYPTYERAIPVHGKRCSRLCRRLRGKHCFHAGLRLRTVRLLLWSFA